MTTRYKYTAALYSSTRSSLISHAGLVGRHDVLDVDEGVLATVLLEHLERLLDQIGHVLAPLLRVVDALAHVNCE